MPMRPKCYNRKRDHSNKKLTSGPIAFFKGRIVMFGKIPLDLRRLNGDPRRDAVSFGIVSFFGFSLLVLLFKVALS